MATQTVYIDPEGRRQTGYIIDGLTYTDPQGTNRVPVGSMVQTGGGVYQLTNQGGVRIGNTLPVATATGRTASATLPSANSAEQYIKDIYEAQKRAQLSALESAYNQNLQELDAAAQKIPQQYQSARNETAGQSEVQRQAFNEYATGSGLGSGAQAQARLALSNTLQRNLADISRAESDALANIENQQTQLAIQYRNAVQQAIQQGEFEKAKALYDEYKRVDQSRVETALRQAQLDMQRSEIQREQQNLEQQRQLQLAQLLAQYGNFSGYQGIFTPEQIAAMGQAYQQQLAQQQTQQELERRLTEAQIANLLASAARRSAGGGTAGGGTTDWTGDEFSGDVGVGVEDVIAQYANSPGGLDWVYVPGIGRVSWMELERLVDQGVVEEIYDSSTGKYRYRKVR